MPSYFPCWLTLCWSEESIWTIVILVCTNSLTSDRVVFWDLKSLNERKRCSDAEWGSAHFFITASLWQLFIFLFVTDLGLPRECLEQRKTFSFFFRCVGLFMFLSMGGTSISFCKPLDSRHVFCILVIQRRNR